MTFRFAIAIVMAFSALCGNAQEAVGARAPKVGLRTNLLYDAALVPNIGVQIAIGENWAVALDVQGAWWGGPNHSRSWRIYGAELGAAYYLSGEKTRLKGHHVGAYLQLYTYDFKLGERGYLGGEPAMNIFRHPTFGAGVEYGYTLPVSSLLAFDFSLGIGWSEGRCMEYERRDDHDVWLRTTDRTWIGPTRAAVSLVWYPWGR